MSFFVCFYKHQNIFCGFAMKICTFFPPDWSFTTYFFLTTVSQLKKDLVW